MPGFTVSVDASRALERIRHLRDGTRPAVGDAMDTVGSAIVELARSIVHVRTGTLQASIYSKYSRNDMVLDVGATAAYAFYVEYGTWKMAAQPYIRPAVDAQMPNLQENIRQAMITLFESG